VHCYLQPLEKLNPKILNYVQIFKVTQTDMIKLNETVLNIQGDIRLLKATRKISPTKFFFVDQKNRIHVFVLIQSKLIAFQILEPFDKITARKFLSKDTKKMNLLNFQIWKFLKILVQT